MSEIIVEKADKVVSVIIDRPPVNALTIALYQRIAEVFEEIGTFSDVNCAVLLARGSRAFCAGLDLREFLAAKVEDDPVRAGMLRRMFFTGMPITAQEAYRVGFVDRVVPLDRLMTEVNALAVVIGNKAPL